MYIIIPSVLKQAQKEFSEAERNMWIRERVSRLENPIILVLYVILVSAGSFVTFKNYFVDGRTYSFWTHIAAFIALPIALGIIHKILNTIFKKVVSGRCPIQSAAQNAEADANALLAEFKRLNACAEKGFFAAGYPFLSPIIFVLCFAYFAWIQKLPIPDTCILYLVVISIFFIPYGTGVLSVTTQAIDLPISDEVRKMLEEFEKDQEEQAKKDAEHAKKLQLELDEVQRKKEQRAQEAAAKEKLAQDANETYLKAVEQGTVDEQLLYQSAQVGSIDACRHIGHLLLERMDSAIHTTAEKREYAEKVAACLETRASLGDVEIKYLWCYARSIYERNNVIRWRKLLDEVRTLHESGKLPMQYQDHCTMLIQNLVQIIDEMDKERAEQMARPRHYRCRYCGNGICTLHSDSVTMITCDYVANPEYCPSVLRNRRYLETVYDD